MFACHCAVCATYKISCCQTALPLQVSTEKSRAQEAAISAERPRAKSAADNQQHVAEEASKSAADLATREEEAAAGNAGEYLTTCMQDLSCQDLREHPCIHHDSNGRWGCQSTALMSSPRGQLKAA